MVFSSAVFLFFFLPLVLILYFLAGKELRNFILLVASLFFYAWGEGFYVLLMLFSISVNYVVGLMLHWRMQRHGNAKPVLAIGVVLNLAPLAFFKYANFVVDNLNQALEFLDFPTIPMGEVHLPIGISFFTFQAISYIVDIYRRDADLQKNPLNLALYISLFPQLIAGPIVRYNHVANEILTRRTNIDDLYTGIVRFVIGLGKKVLIANVMGRLADAVFDLPPATLSTPLAWLGILSYTLQIYFDFSGYSDMAIGLGRMFGFHFHENFNYPYISKSIQEFWRRWHISLSTWFRDYLYIPLGGSHGSTGRTYFNLVLVFFLCGLWHGASWTFIAWGLYHGAFLILERTRFGGGIRRLPAWMRHGYVLLVVMIGWVFFRSVTFDHAYQYLQAMFSFRFAPYADAWTISAMNREYFLVLFVALVASTPIKHTIYAFFHSVNRRSWTRSRGWVLAVEFGKVATLAMIFIYSAASLMGGAHNPFLYFRF